MVVEPKTLRGDDHVLRNVCRLVVSEDEGVGEMPLVYVLAHVVDLVLHVDDRPGLDHHVDAELGTFVHEGGRVDRRAHSCLRSTTVARSSASATS